MPGGHTTLAVPFPPGEGSTGRGEASTQHRQWPTRPTGETREPKGQVQGGAYSWGYNAGAPASPSSQLWPQTAPGTWDPRVPCPNRPTWDTPPCWGVSPDLRGGQEAACRGVCGELDGQLGSAWAYCVLFAVQNRCCVSNVRHSYSMSQSHVVLFHIYTDEKNKRIPGRGHCLCEVATFCPCLCGFSPGTLVSAQRCAVR